MSIQNFPEQRDSAQRMKWEKVVARTSLDAPELSERLYKMINYAAGRVDYYENARQRYLTIGLAFFAGGIAFGTLLSRVQEYVPRLPLALAVISMLFVVLTGLILVLFYNATTEPEYTYRLIADIRSWYFRYHFPENRRLVVSRRKERARTQAQEMTGALDYFLNRWLEFADEKKRFVAEDLEQVFILFLVQRYKSQIVTRMSNILAVGVLAAVVAVISALLLWMKMSLGLTVLVLGIVALLILAML